LKIDAVSEHSLILMVFPNNIGDLLASHQAGDFLTVEFPRNLRGTFDSPKITISPKIFVFKRLTLLQFLRF